MATTVANLTAVISANNTRFKKGVGGAQGVLNNFKKSVMALGPAIASAFAVTKIISFGKESLRLYDIQAKAEKSLLVALKGREDAQQKLIAQAKALQKETLFGDEETIKAQALIAAFVEEEAQIKKVIPLVQDMATAKGMDLAGAADLVSKTLGSSTNALSRYGIEVTGAVGSTERLDSLVRGLSGAFEGQAKAAAETGLGIQTQLTNVIGDLKEQVGELVVEGLDLVKVLGNVKSVLEQWDLVQMAKNFREFKQENSQWIDIVKAGLNPLKAYNKEVWRFAKTLFKIGKGELANWDDNDIFAGFMEANPVEIADGVDTVTLAIKNFDSALKEISTTEEDIDIGSSLIELGNQQDGIIERHRKWEIATRKTANATEILDGKMADMNATMQEGFKDEPKISATFQNYTDAMKDLDQQVAQLAVRLAGDLAYAFGQAAGGMEGLGETIAELGSMITEALGDIMIAVGLKIGIEKGWPLILAGLGLKGYAGYQRGMNSRSDSVDQGSGMSKWNEFTIRGDNLVTAYDSNKSMNQRLY